jgi:hypothetical protein
MIYIHSDHKLIIYLPTMYKYCVYPAMSKSPNQVPHDLATAQKVTEEVLNRT